MESVSKEEITSMFSIEGQSQRSDLSALDGFKKANGSPPNSTDEMNEQIKNVQNEINSKLHRCDQCEKTYKTKANMKRHRVSP